jgi:hypothetical protein
VIAEVGFGLLRPQFGQLSALELISLPHSLHFTSAILPPIDESIPLRKI